MPFRIDSSPLQIQCVCVSDTPAPPIPVPGQQGFWGSKIAKPAPILCPRCYRPGQIVLPSNVNDRKTPRKIGLKGRVIAEAQKGCLAGKKDPKMPKRRNGKRLQSIVKETLTKKPLH